MTTTGGFLGTSISGLLAFQRSLATTSHNIANVNTPGYSRQRVEMVSRQGQQFGYGFQGAGVDVQSVTRVYDQFLTNQVRAGTSSHSQLQQYYSLASQIDNLLADPAAGLGPGLQDFFNAVQGVANDPTSIPARQVMLSQGDALVQRVQYLDRYMGDLRRNTNTDIQNSVNDINSYGSSIARLNREIVAARGAAGGAPPNDLLDQRDQLVARLSELVTVNTVEQDDGALNVFIGNGQNLVVGATSGTLGVTGNPYDATRYEVTYVAGGVAAVISDKLSGGKLGGTLDFRNQVLDQAQNALGRVATGLAMTFNVQHAAGQDLNGNLGGAFFNYNGPQAVASSSNSGAGTVTATISAVSDITTSDYRLRYDGAGSYSLLRLSDNNTVASGAGPFTVDGLTVTPGGAPNVGDSFLIQPTRKGGQGLSVAIADTRAIAAAAPIRSSASLSNTGGAIVSAGSVLDVTDPNLLTTTTINFVGPGSYQINGAGPVLAFTSGADIDVNGWRVQITGAPAAGDVFTVQQNTGGGSDNRNALALAGLQTRNTLAGGSTSFQGAYGQFVGDVAARTRQAEILEGAQQALLGQAIERRDSMSAVNLDEEAANMVRFQQAYQAAAQMIGVADTLFQSLLAAVRG